MTRNRQRQSDSTSRFIDAFQTRNFVSRISCFSSVCSQVLVFLSLIIGFSTMDFFQAKWSELIRMGSMFVNIWCETRNSKSLRKKWTALVGTARLDSILMIVLLAWGLCSRQQELKRKRQSQAVAIKSGHDTKIQDQDSFFSLVYANRIGWSVPRWVVCSCSRLRVTPSLCWWRVVIIQMVENPRFPLLTFFSNSDKMR